MNKHLPFAWGLDDSNFPKIPTRLAGPICCNPKTIDHSIAPKHASGAGVAQSFHSSRYHLFKALMLVMTFIFPFGNNLFANGGNNEPLSTCVDEVTGSVYVINLANCPVTVYCYEANGAYAGQTFNMGTLNFGQNYTVFPSASSGTVYCKYGSTTTSTVNFSGGYHTLYNNSCGGGGGGGSTSCTVAFTNTGCQTAELFWNNNGTLVSYGHVTANSTKNQSTYNGTAWVIKVGSTTVGNYTVNCSSPTYSFNSGGCAPSTCTVAFTNTGCQTAELFWNNNGTLVSYGHINGGSTKNQGTINGHAWVIKVGSTTVGNYTVNCNSPSYSFNAGGNTPTPQVTLTQPTCTNPKGKIVITNLPNGYWSILNNSAWVQNKTLYDNLNPGTYQVGIGVNSCNKFINVTINNFGQTPGTACNDGNPNTTNDVVQANGCTCAGTPVTTSVDLELTKTANATTVTTGQTVVWTISVVNKGPAAATGVTVKDNFPTGLTYNSANASQGNFNVGTLTWNIGNLAVNQTVTLTINTTVTATSGTIRNFAQVQTASPNDVDSTPGNDNNQTPNEDDEDDATINVQPAGTGVEISNCGNDCFVFEGNVDYKVIGNSMSFSEDQSNCNQKSSSSASLSIPSGANIVKAYLQWSGSGSTDNAVNLNGAGVTAQKTYTDNSLGTLTFFGAYADVTAMVQGGGSFTVSGLSWSNASAYCNANAAYGAWSMVVVYSSPSLSSARVHVCQDKFNLTFPANDYSSSIGCVEASTNCPSNAKLTIVTFESDGYKGEYLYIGGQYFGDNNFNGQTAPNLDIATFSVGSLVNGNTTSLGYTIESYNSNSVWGPATEGLFDFVKVLKYDVCGTPVDPCASQGGDSDGDGVCNNQDCQPNNPAFPATPGTACNDGNPNTTNDVVTANGCGCAGTPVNPCASQGGDSDGDGVCNNQDCQPNNPAFPATPGTACNDGNPNTTNDVVTANGCGCAGTPVNPCASQGGDSDGDGVCNNQDCQPNNPAFPATPGTACNDGNPNTTNDVVTANGCGCAGTPVATCTISAAVSDIVCNNNGTPNNAGDDTYTFKITVTKNGSCGTSWSGGGKTGNYGTAVSFGPYPISGGNKTITVCDNQVTTACATVTATAPGTCSGGGTPDCEAGISITTGNGSIIVSGLGGAPISALQIFTSNWQSVFSCFANCNGTETISVPAGTYLVYAKYYTAGYSLICEKQATVTVGGGGGTCDNVTNAGTIGFGTACTGATDYCPNQGAAPVVKNCVAPSGGAGNLEVIWLKSTTSCTYPTTTITQIQAGQDPHWTIIAGATSLDYSPGNVTQQTCYLRCTRRAGCPNYVESNIVTLGISTNCGGGGGGGNPDCANVVISAGPGSISVAGLNGAPVTSVQIFSATWQPEHNCFANCQSPAATFSVTAGAHYVIVKYYTASYQLICEVNQTVNVVQALEADQSDKFQFEAIKHLEHVELIWLHNGDYKVDEYVLERSLDGTDFEEVYATASDKSVAADVYEGFDLEPQTGVNYYRVRMLNEDGTERLSEVKEVVYEDIIDFGLFPNPANGFTNLNLESVVGKHDVDIHIYNNMGLRMKQFHLDEVWSKYYQMDLRDLHEGHYTVWVNVPGKRPRAVTLVIGRL